VREGTAVILPTPPAALPTSDYDPLAIQGEPLVSVLIPWYHGEPWAAQLERTLLGQTYPHWEAVIVADGCAGPQFDDPRFRVLEKPHGGISAATNHALEAARGEYIALLDQDDEFEPECLERLLSRLFERPDWGGVTARETRIWPDREEVTAKGPFGRLDELESHRIGHPLLLRRECCLPHRPGFEPAQDAEFGVRLTDRYTLGYDDALLYRWHLHGANPSLVQRDLQRHHYQRAVLEAKERRKERPNLAFVLPGLPVAGGVRVVCDLARRLKEAGFSTCLVDTSGQWGNDLSRSLGRPYDVPAPPRQAAGADLGDVPVWNRVPWPTDLALGTSWDDTVLWALAHEAERHGRAGWIVQDWEADWSPDNLKENPGVSRLVTTAVWVRDRALKEWGTEIPWLPWGYDAPEPPSRTRPQTPRCLLAVRWHWRKNPEGTLRLARAIRDRLGWPLSILCKDGARPEMEDLADCLVTDASDADVLSLYRESAFFVSCSNQEGQFLMATEAMAQGCVPVVQAWGTEHIPDYAGVRLPDPEDLSAYLKALGHAWTLWNSYSQAARAEALRWRWEKVLPRWIALFREWME
jgi:hypothetical protein